MPAYTFKALGAQGAPQKGLMKAKSSKRPMRQYGQHLIE